MLTFHIITLFPQAFRSYLGESIIARAIRERHIAVKFYNPRDYTDDKWARVDRRPYGGGPGMVLQALPFVRAIESALKSKIKGKKSKVKIVWLSPSGKQFDTKLAKNYAKKYTDIIFICGRYEGIDARVKRVYKVEEVSVGPFVLTGGELPAMMVMDCISRQIEDVLGDINSLEENRIASPDVYTRPESFKYKGRTHKVPKVLLSGHHVRIDDWRGGRKSGKARHFG